MPVTGNMDQEHPTQELVEQTSFIDSGQILGGQKSFNGAEVSSTTVDPDPGSETTQSPAFQGSELVTSIDAASSDSLDGFKEKAPSFDELTSKPSSSSQASVSRGFQDAFAAFASASFREPEEGSPMDIGNDVSETITEPGQEPVSNYSTVDSLVSSAIDSGQVTTTVGSFGRSGVEDNVHSVLADTSESGTEQSHAVQTQYSEPSQAESAAGDSVYFIQTTDASGQVVTSIIDPNDIPTYTDSVVYKQCMRPDGEIETTIVYSAGMAVAHEDQPQEQVAVAHEETDSQQGDQPVIYAHDINGHLTPIDSAQSFNDVAPPGKQFVYMQDSTGRIIRTVMDANQTMVPGQQVYYTQSEDGRIITSVVDPSSGVSDEATAEQQSQETGDQIYQQSADGVTMATQEASSSVVGGATNFNIDNSMSGLSMLAELSHLTAGQAFNTTGLTTEQRAASSSTDSSSMDQDDFRPVAMVTKEVAADEGMESVNTDIAGLKVDQEETLITKMLSLMKDEQIQASYTVSKDNLFVQWQNLDAMCWMDVILIMLVNSPTLRPLTNLDPAHELGSTLLITLLKANRQAQTLLQNILKKSNGAEISNLQTGAGNSASMQDPKTSKLVCKENMDEIGKAINILYAMREKIWQALHPRLRCERGKHNSPVLVLPLLVREKPAIKQMFTMTYRYLFKCKQCGYSQDDSHSKILPSIPAVPEDFSMQAPCFVRNCFECQAPNQRMLMKFEVLHDFVQMHFVKGLPHNRFDELSFDLRGDHYEVTAVVHYKNNPDHFIAWVRNAPGPAWMECDDLKSVITCYSNVPPNIPPGQVHMVLWERRLTPQHTLVMRDTEDTKLLASLVLTVQQPNVQPPTDPAARATGLPSIPASTAASPVTTATQATSTQPGVMTQTFTYTPRQRGRGRGRGSYGARGQALSTPVIRRVSPGLTQLPSPSQTSPQVIQLPLSALTNSGLSLRGNTSGATRYILVGNNSQSGPVSSTTPGRNPAGSKVVVVRSQGGATNFSAAQLLQLLQRTGAIKQTGARITTTVTTAGAASEGTAAGSTTSYIIQQDGSIVTAPGSSDVAAGQLSLEKTELPGSSSFMDSPNEQIGESAAETESVESQQNEHIKSTNQTISTLPYLGTVATTRGETITQSTEEAPAVSSASQVETLASSSDVETTGDQSNVSAQTITLTQPAKYIQVPNPAGGGMLLCQLGTRDGKMVLVPVDKNVQSQLSGASHLKVSNTPSSSPKITIRVPATSPQVTGSSSAAVLAQIQQQLLQSQSTSTSSATGHRFITLPSSTGNKRIQLITVPRGASAPQASQPGPKTIIMNAASNQQTAVTTTPSMVTRLVSHGEVGSGNSILSQSGNIVIRELKKAEGDAVTTMSTTLGMSSQGVDAGAGRTTTQTVSLFKDVPTRPATSSLGTSLLTTSPLKNQKAQENFRYILPGSNTTHILHTGPSSVQGGLGQAGRAFTALSSSGTIIGGQLTPASASAETSPMDEDLPLDEGNAAANSISSSPSISSTPRRQLSRELDTTEYIPLGRSHGRGRGQRGRGRGGRTPRGRGRSKPWTSDSDFTPPVTVTSRKISTLADLRQIGAHVIEAGSETVDGVPVVSIPDFSTEGTGPSEILSAARSIISDAATANTGQDTSSQLVLSNMEEENLAISASQGPRVITQPIPSVRANHGFDILTQGILGSDTATRPAPQRQVARSLLTGATTTLHTASSLLTSLTETASSSLLATPTTQQGIGQAEIDTLIQAAQAAAKLSLASPQKYAGDVSLKDASSFLEMTSQIGVSDFGTEDINKEVHVNDEDMNASEDTAQDMSVQTHQGEQGETVESIDEAQVSAAERYRMPVELFQPDEESPEKPLKSDDNANKLAVDLPSKLFEEPEFGYDMSKSPLQQNKDSLQAAGKRGKTSVKGQFTREETLTGVESLNNENSFIKYHKELELTTNAENSTKAIVESDLSFEKSILDSSAEDSFRDTVDVRRPTDGLTTDDSLKPTEEAGPDSDLPVKKVGRPRGRPKGSKSNKRGRRKSSNINVSVFADSIEESAADVVTPETSPERKNVSMTISPEVQFSQRSPSSSPTKYSKISTDANIVSDLQLKSDDENEHKIVEGEIPTNTGTGDQEPEAILKELIPIKSPDKEKEIVVKKRIVHSPAFVRHKKEKVNWAVCTDNEVLTRSESFFNYKVLSGRPSKSRYRHPSLGPVQELFVFPLEPFPVNLRREHAEPQKSSAALVIRRSPKPLKKPRSDPAKDPTVVPLVFEDNDPSCMSGSVVTSPNGREIFTGVAVRHKVETADWSTFLDDDVEEALENLPEEELKAAQKDYRKQLMTVFFMHAGVFSAPTRDSSDESCLEADEYMKGDENVMQEESFTEEKATEKGIIEQEKIIPEEKPDEAINESSAGELLNFVQVVKPSSSRGRPKKRQPSTELSTSSTQPTKKAKSSQDEESDSNLQSSSQSVYFSDIDSSDASSATVLSQSRINGIDTITSPAHSSQMSDSEILQKQQKETSAAALTQLPFHSPSRRSSRTPVPSKKVLDSWEDFPVRSALKDKRTLSQSSDDELSGYGSGDLKRKKQKTKQPFSPS